MCKKYLFTTLCAFPFLLSCTQTNPLGDFPEGSRPEEVGKILSQRFVEKGNVGKMMSYAKTFTWNGSLRFAEATGDKQLLKQLQDKFEPIFGPNSKALPKMNHVDANMFGSLPLTLYQLTDEERYRKLGMPYADSQWNCPEEADSLQKDWDAKGYTWQTRLWIDDMYMIPAVQLQAYKVTEDRKYIDRTAREMVLYLDSLQRPNGLFYHAPDVPYYWGRGNGWMAAGMADVLASLPEDSEYRTRILQGYHTMMESLLKYQNEEGLWNQLIDQSDCWTETSGSAMFTYAFIQGVKHGWLDAKTYAPAARKAWLALVKYINEKGDVREVCVGTNKKNDKQYYYDRPRNVGDYHGQAPMLWCVGALLAEEE